MGHHRGAQAHLGRGSMQMDVCAMKTGQSSQSGAWHAAHLGQSSQSPPAEACSFREHWPANKCVPTTITPAGRPTFLSMRRSLEKEREAKGEGDAAQPLLAGTRHSDLDAELGVVTDGALERLLGAEGKDPEQAVLEQLAVKYEHGAWAHADGVTTGNLLCLRRHFSVRPPAHGAYSVPKLPGQVHTVKSFQQAVAVSARLAGTCLR